MPWGRMSPYTLKIKNMVCPRCKLVVEQQLAACRLEAKHIALGEVVLAGKPSKTQWAQLQKALEATGFQILEDRQSQLTERIKNIIVNAVHHSKEVPADKLSALLTAQLPHDYSYLSKLFSETEGTTIEKYAIAQRTERVKELLLYGELSLSQIADDMGYSSVAYLSNQFKKITGTTPTAFRRQKEARRQGIDKV